MRNIFKFSFTNPFDIYIGSFSLVILVYTLEWSDLYPKLDLSLILFFILTFIISFVIGKSTYVNDRVKSFKEIEAGKFYWVGSFILFLCLFFEIINAGGIPLVLILNGSNFNYQEYGIKSLHVFFMSANGYFCTYLFHCYISKKSKKKLLLYILHVSFFLIIYSRGFFLYALTSSLFIYLNKNRVDFQKLITITVAFLLILYGFGVLGNLRSGTDDYDKYLLEWAEANEKFEKSNVPQPYFWSYLYIASPLANVQETINRTPNTYFWQNVDLFIIGEMLPDFISKRIFESQNIEPKVMDQVHMALNVGTIYARPYKYLGWNGMIIIYVYLSVFILFFLRATNLESNYSVSLIATLNTIMLYNMFDNMIWFSGLSLQLVYPVFFSILEKFKINNGIVYSQPEN